MCHSGTLLPQTAAVQGLPSPAPNQIAVGPGLNQTGVCSLPGLNQTAAAVCPLPGLNQTAVGPVPELNQTCLCLASRFIRRVAAAFTAPLFRF